MAASEAKLNEFVMKVLGDTGAAFSGALVLVGDRLGLYKAMAGAGPLTPGELAERTGTEERYVREWLSNQAASGYVEYAPETGRFTLREEQALVFAHEDSPVFMAGSYDVM